MIYHIWLLQAAAVAEVLLAAGLVVTGPQHYH
jgi:hypothetical protein